MNSRFRFAAATIASFIKLAMRLRGGKLSKSTRWKPPSSFGNKAIPRPSVPDAGSGQLRYVNQRRVLGNVCFTPKSRHGVCSDAVRQWAYLHPKTKNTTVAAAKKVT
jgi:hypothetical protein